MVTNEDRAVQPYESRWKVWNSNLGPQGKPQDYPVGSQGWESSFKDFVTQSNTTENYSPVTININIRICKCEIDQMGGNEEGEKHYARKPSGCYVNKTAKQEQASKQETRDIWSDDETQQIKWYYKPWCSELKGDFQAEEKQVQSISAEEVRREDKQEKAKRQRQGRWQAQSQGQGKDDDNIDENEDHVDDEDPPENKEHDKDDKGNKDDDEKEDHDDENDDESDDGNEGDNDDEGDDENEDHDDDNHDEDEAHDDEDENENDEKSNENEEKECKINPNYSLGDVIKDYPLPTSESVTTEQWDDADLTVPGTMNEDEEEKPCDESKGGDCETVKGKTSESVTTEQFVGAENGRKEKKRRKTRKRKRKGKRYTTSDDFSKLKPLDQLSEMEKRASLLQDHFVQTITSDNDRTKAAEKWIAEKRRQEDPQEGPRDDEDLELEEQLESLSNDELAEFLAESKRPDFMSKDETSDQTRTKYSSDKKPIVQQETIEGAVGKSFDQKVLKAPCVKRNTSPEEKSRRHPQEVFFDECGASNLSSFDGKRIVQEEDMEVARRKSLSRPCWLLLSPESTPVSSSSDIALAEETETTVLKEAYTQTASLGFIQEYKDVIVQTDPVQLNEEESMEKGLAEFKRDCAERKLRKSRLSQDIHVFKTRQRESTSEAYRKAKSGHGMPCDTIFGSPCYKEGIWQAETLLNSTTSDHYSLQQFDLSFTLGQSSHKEDMRHAETSLDSITCCTDLSVIGSCRGSGASSTSGYSSSFRNSPSEFLEGTFTCNSLPKPRPKRIRRPDAATGRRPLPGSQSDVPAGTVPLSETHSDATTGKRPLPGSQSDVPSTVSRSPLNVLHPYVEWQQSASSHRYSEVSSNGIGNFSLTQVANSLSDDDDSYQTAGSSLEYFYSLGNVTDIADEPRAGIGIEDRGLRDANVSIEECLDQIIDCVPIGLDQDEDEECPENVFPICTPEYLD